MVDLEGLLVNVGAVQPNDHRVSGLGEARGETAYSSTRSGKSNNVVVNDDDDDWD